MNFSESDNVQYLDVIIKFEVYLPYKELSTYDIFTCTCIYYYKVFISLHVMYNTSASMSRKCFRGRG